MFSSNLSKLTASALAAAALVPAAALAADTIQLDGKPVLSQATAHQATLTFQTDAPLPRRENGGIKGSVTFDSGVSSIATSRHADNRYMAWLQTRKTLKRGTSYKVRISIDGQAPIVRTLRLK